MNNETDLIKFFGEQYIHDAIRIMHTRRLTLDDGEMAIEAICMLTSLYMQKIQNGEIVQDTIH